mgnify:CR=1 FL=1
MKIILNYLWKFIDLSQNKLKKLSQKIKISSKLYSYSNFWEKFVNAIRLRGRWGTFIDGNKFSVSDGTFKKKAFKMSFSQNLTEVKLNDDVFVSFHLPEYDVSKLVYL